MWNMRFDSWVGKGNVNKNVFAGVVEILTYICVKLLLVLPGISPVIARSVGVRLINPIRELLKNWLWICSADGSLQGSVVAEKWQITGYERGKKPKDTAMSLAGGREGKNIVILSSHSRRVLGTLRTCKDWKPLGLHKYSILKEDSSCLSHRKVD